MLSSRTNFGAVAAVFCAVGLLAMPFPAAAQDASIGIRATGAWSSLPQPDDPRGEPTLMSGTAFSGFGYSAGLWSGTTIAKMDDSRLRLDISVLYSHLNTSGFEQRGDARREAVIKTRLLRVPILAVYESSTTGSTARVGAGFEPLIGIWSGASVRVENSDESPEPLFTTPVTHLGLTALVGYDVAVSDSFDLPVELRLTYDPMVGSSTVDRFQDFESSSSPGDYEAAFRWQVLFATGFSFDI